MNRPRKNLPFTIWLGLAVLAGMAIAAFALLRSERKLPRYEGQTLYEWVAKYQKAARNYRDPNRGREVEACQKAIRAIGTNALPFAMADVTAHRTVEDKIVDWLAQHFKFLKLQPRSLFVRWNRGISTLEVLGPIANPCLPALIANTTNSGGSESALMALGPAAIPAFTNLLAKSKFPQTGNLIGAFANSVYAGRISPDDAAVALPLLVQVFHSQDSHGRWYAAGAFGAIHQQQDLCVPLLIEGLSGPNSATKSACIQSLAEFGGMATNAIPALEQSCSDVDVNVRSASTNALREIRRNYGTRYTR